MVKNHSERGNLLPPHGLLYPIRSGQVRVFKLKDKYVRISMKEIWCNLDGPPKNKELWSYVVNV